MCRLQNCKLKTGKLIAAQIANPIILDPMSKMECNYLYDKDTNDRVNENMCFRITPLIAPVDHNNEKIDLLTAWKNRMKKITSYQKRMPDFELDTIIALGISMKCPKDALDDVAKWSENSIRWLTDTFDIAPDGKSNLLALSLHTCREDATKVALYATIIPIDENGEFISDYSEDSVWNEETLLSSYKEAIHFTDKEDAVA